MKFLRPIERWRWHPAIESKIDAVLQAGGGYVTVFEGKLTGHVWVQFHQTTQVRPAILEGMRAHELAALHLHTTAGALQ